MGSHTKTKLTLRKETIRDLTPGQIARVAAGAGRVAPTLTACSEPTGFVGRCQDNPPNGGGAPQAGPRFPWPVRDPHAHSYAYCRDTRPLSGYTLPPTAQD